MRGFKSDVDRDGFVPFSVSVALAVAFCALCGAINEVARAPIAPLLSVAAAGGAVCAISLGTKSRMTVYRWVPRFAGSIVGVALSIAAAVISQSQHLASETGIPPPFLAASSKLAESSAANREPIRPLR
jgi:hypothetical protein